MTQQSPSGPQPQDNARPKNSRQPHRLAKFFDKERGPLCFQCKQWGHVGVNCPERNVLRVETTRPHETEGLPDLFAMGSILGKPARFFLDSGADHSMVNVNHLNQLKEWNLAVPESTTSVTVKGVIGKHITLPVLSLSCTLLDMDLTVEMAVSSDIPHDILLGKNCTALFHLLRRAKAEDPQDVLAVRSRSNLQRPNGGGAD